MPDKITITRNVKKIKVNDDGEFITIDLGDQEFLAGLVEIIRGFDENKSLYYQKINDVKAMPDGTRDEQLAQTIALSDLSTDICRRLKGQLDSIFHDEVCRKVFGNITPGIDLFAEFFSQLAPIIKNAASEQNKRIRKYTEKYTAK